MQTVLIVDDSLTAIRQLETIVKGSGDFVCVGAARNGVEAIRLYHEKHPDVVCMDLNMPEMDGLATLRYLRSLACDVRVVVISSVGCRDGWYLQAVELGAARVLSKPADAGMVLKALRNV